MGCAFGKDSQYSHDHEIERLKLENDYNVQKRNRGRPIGDAPGKAFVHQQGNNKVVVVNAGGEKMVSREGEKVANGGNVLQRVTSRKIGVDEFVDGWPKWLVDNIPGDVLGGLVPKSADSYDKLAKVGQGTYSNVYKALDRETGKIVALKKVRFDTSEPESVKFMAREITTLQKLDHPNVIKLEGIATSRMQYSLYLVFDYMQSDLAKIICRPGERLTEPQVKCYMQQLLSGLQHCHERGILHRDIKGSNLLIDKQGMLKIADFGLANTFASKQKHPLTSRVVTLWYRAPELLLGSTDYGVGIDLWSAGCLLAEMFVGKPIMPGRTEVEQLHRIFKLCGSPSEDYWKKMKLQPSFRSAQTYKPSFQEAFRGFPRSSFGLLTTLLALDPGFRGTAASALQSLFFCSSPLACDLSGLPVIRKEEDELDQIGAAKRHRASKSKKSSRMHRKGHVRKNQTSGKSEGDNGSHKEQDKSAVANMQGQETGNSSSSTSFSLKPTIQERGLYGSFLPVRRSQQQKSLPITVGHPNATKNIQNFTLLQASIADIVNHNHSSGGGSTEYRRSVSTLDFRALDLDKISKLFELSKSLSMENDH